MFIFLLNIKKSIYIIFILTFLSLICSTNSFSSNNILAIEELEISEGRDLEFSRKKIIDNAFQIAFNKLLTQILNSSDRKKIKKVNLKEIKNLVENFKIKNEVIREEKYFAIFDVYFNKKKTKKFLERKNLFYSNPKKITVMFLPIIVKKDRLYFFNENVFYKNWLKKNDQSELVRYIMPLEDIDEISSLASSKEKIEDLNMLKISKKYNTENYILSIINIDKDKINFFSKIKFEGNKKNINQIFNKTNIEDQNSIEDIIKDAKIRFNDIWKDFNVINTSMKLSINIILNSKDHDTLFKFENALKKIDDINSFSIKKITSEKTIYEIIYNSDPKKLKKQFSANNVNIFYEEGLWLVK